MSYLEKKVMSKEYGIINRSGRYKHITIPGPCNKKFLGVQNPFYKKGFGRRRHNDE